MLVPSTRSYDGRDLGRSLTSWLYQPAAGRKVATVVAGVVVALALMFIAYGGHFVPWLKKLSGTMQTLVVLLLPPLFAYLARARRNRVYTLFEQGVLVQLSEGKTRDKGNYALWPQFAGCAYDEHGVRLLPRQPLRRPLYLPARANRMEVYSICRERIDAFRFAGHKQSAGGHAKKTGP